MKSPCRQSFVLDVTVRHSRSKWDPLPIDQSKGQPDSLLTMFWESPCCALSLLAAAVRFTPSLLSSFFNGSMLLLVVLAGHLPQVATIDHCFTEAHLSTSERIEITITIRLMPISPSPLTRQSVLVASYSIYVINRYAAPSILWDKHCLPLRTVDMTCSRHMPSSP